MHVAKLCFPLASLMRTGSILEPALGLPTNLISVQPLALLLQLYRQHELAGWLELEGCA